MTTFSLGRQAEAAATRYLQEIGFRIIDQNWRTRYCEIDIVAQRLHKVWFIEVKYRRRQQQGKGFDYVTPQKLRRMRFAAELWVHHFHWANDYELAAIEVSGPAFAITGVARC